MVGANIHSVFIGIETPNEASLRETKKYQNVRRGGTILDRIHTIQDAGIEVWCGMILGFDHDDSSIFDAQRTFIREAGIAHAMVGMLHAIPKTPLHARLLAEGRLDPADEPAFGTNVITLQIGRKELRDGYVGVLKALYEPEAYFARVEDLYLRRRIVLGRGQARYWRRHPWQRLKARVTDLLRAAVLQARLLWRLPDWALRGEYLRRMGRLLKVRRDPVVLVHYLVKCAMHYHHHEMARQMASARATVVNSF